MNKIILGIICSLLVLPPSRAWACVQKFKVYYMPMDAQFYVPLTIKDIETSGAVVNLNSCNISALFKSLNKQRSIKATDELDALRVIIVNKTDKKELFITFERKIISEGRVYSVKPKTIDNSLKDIRKAMTVSQRKKYL